jgi:hypothetical protein
MEALSRSKFKDSLVAVGDSHIDMFTYFCNATCRVVGASAMGLSNEHSLTQARRAFSSFLKTMNEFTPLICVGEVDCNSIAWKSTLSCYDAIQISINNLFTFLKEFNKSFIISSVILPPVNSYIGMHFRTDVAASKEARTALVKHYNKIVKERARLENHYFLDITTPTTGPDGFVAPNT